MTDDLTDAQGGRLPAGFESMNWTRGFGRSIGPLSERIEGEAYVRAFLVAEQHTNGMMNCHGGMLMAFADVAFGHIVSLRTGGKFWVTVRLLVDFVSAVRLGDWVEGTGELVGQDGDLFFVQGRIWCGERTILTGTGTFKSLDDPRIGR
jgi:uncharacterized protein (TIGR00369 family)